MFLLEDQETARIRFRKIQHTDFDFWLPFFKDPSSFLHWKQELEPPEIECGKWYTNQLNRYQENRGGMNALVSNDTGELIGHCGLLVQEVDGITELEIGYSLLPCFRGHGYATEAARKCRDFAFDNDFSGSLISIISLSNTPSIHVAIKNGMVAEKQTVYKGNDVTIFRIQKADWDSIR